MPTLLQRLAPWRRFRRGPAGIAAAVGLLLGLAATSSHAADPVRIKVVGGLGGINQFTQHEEPFWTRTISEVSGGRIQATIHPFDRSGLRGQDMLQLISLGVVPFGTALVSITSGEEPEIGAVDLPALNPDMETLRRSVAAFRPYLARTLKERFRVELLGVYAYPAQVIYCAKPFKGLTDLAGRKIRTSSVAQSEAMAALGAVPVITPFSEVVQALSAGVVECAITGTLSGYEIGLPEVTTHVHAVALSWGISIFGANQTVWDALPGDLREVVRSGVAGLETRIWEASERDTARGLACNTGAEACVPARKSAMTLVPASPSDAVKRRELLVGAVLPKWIERCGEPCQEVWRATIGPALGLESGPP